MKSMLLVVLGILFVSALQAQTVVCPDEEIELSIPDNFEGTIQWQFKRPNGNWIDINGGTTNGFLFNPSNKDIEIRAKVTQPECEPIYSEIQQVVETPDELDISLDIPDVFCSGESVMLKVQDTFGGDLQWQIKNGNSWANIDGATINNYEFLPSASSVQVRARIRFGDCGQFVSSARQLNEVDNFDDVKILSPESYCSGDQIELNLDQQFNSGIEWQQYLNGQWITLDQSTSSTLVIVASEDNYTIRALIRSECGESSLDQVELTSNGAEIEVLFDANDQYYLFDSIQFDIDGLLSGLLISDFDTVTISQGKVIGRLFEIEQRFLVRGQTVAGCEINKELQIGSQPLFRLKSNLFATIDDYVESDSIDIINGELIIDGILDTDILIGSNIYIEKEVRSYFFVKAANVSGGKTKLQLNSITILDILDDGDTIFYNTDFESSGTIGGRENANNVEPINMGLTINGVQVSVEAKKYSADRAGLPFITKSNDQLVIDERIKSMFIEGKLKVSATITQDLNKEVSLSKKINDVTLKLNDFEFKSSSTAYYKNDNTTKSGTIYGPTIGAFAINYVFGFDISNPTLEISSEASADFKMKVNYQTTRRLLYIDASARYEDITLIEGQPTFSWSGLENVDFDFDVNVSINPSMSFGVWVTDGLARIIGTQLSMKGTTSLKLGYRNQNFGSNTYAFNYENKISVDIIGYKVQYKGRDYNFLSANLFNSKVNQYQNPYSYTVDGFINRNGRNANIKYQVYDSRNELSSLNTPLQISVPTGSSDEINDGKTALVNRDNNGNATFDWQTSETSSFTLLADKLFLPDGFESTGGMVELVACPDKLTVDEGIDKVLTKGEKVSLKLLQELVGVDQNIQWQYSLDNQEWKNIELANTRNFDYFPEESQYIRVLFYSSNCYSLLTPLVSEEIYLTVCLKEIEPSMPPEIWINSGSDIELTVGSSIDRDDENLKWYVLNNGDRTALLTSDGKQATGNNYIYQNVIKEATIQAVYGQENCDDIAVREVAINICPSEISINTTLWTNPVEYGSAVTLKINEIGIPNQEALKWERRKTGSAQWQALGMGDAFVYSNITEDTEVRVRYEDENCELIVSLIATITVDDPTPNCNDIPEDFSIYFEPFECCPDRFVPWINVVEESADCYGTLLIHETVDAFGGIPEYNRFYFVNEDQINSKIGLQHALIPSARCFDGMTGRFRIYYSYLDGYSAADYEAIIASAVAFDQVTYVVKEIIVCDPDDPSRCTVTCRTDYN